MQMALVFRADLDAMTRAKSEVQAAHAAEDLVFSLMETNPDLMRRYRSGPRTKVSLEVDTEAALYGIRDKALRRGVPHVIVQDAGKTIFPEPTVTCIILGPMSKTDSNALTRGTRMRDQNVLPEIDGVGIRVGGALVAWFTDMEHAEEWASENHFGQWLAHPCSMPNRPPFTPAQIALAKKEAEKLYGLLGKMKPGRQLEE
jgi:PTH2 family peptidyl-tRNA hydrolase